MPIPAPVACGRLIPESAHGPPHAGVKFSGLSSRLSLSKKMRFFFAPCSTSCAAILGTNIALTISPGVLERDG